MLQLVKFPRLLVLPKQRPEELKTEEATLAVPLLTTRVFLQQVSHVLNV